jgi:hypothetical protein
MENRLVNLTYEIEIKPGEKLTLPDSIAQSLGAGRWIITIQPVANERPPAVTRTHDAFLKGYAPEDEGLYDDY